MADVDWLSVAAYVGLVALALSGFWTILPRVYGAAGTPSRPFLVREALRFAAVQPGERVFDLGAGDGRVVVIAAREFQARAVGIEIEPVHCLVAWLRALLGGVIGRVSVRQQNLFEADLSQADVVFVYLTPAMVERLRPELARKLPASARVVSVYFPFEGWQPADVDVGNLLFLYRMPPRPGSLDAFLRKWSRTSPQSNEATPVDNLSSNK